MNVAHAHDPQWRHDHGGDVVRSADGTVTGRWQALQAMGTGCTLDSGTASSDLRGTLTGLQIPAGATVEARFTAVQLSAGSAVLYQ